MGHYLLNSATERDLANRIIASEFAHLTDEDMYVKNLRILAKKILSSDSKLLSTFPELADSQLDKDFPSTENEITTNLFSEIATTLAKKFTSSADRGAVNTPFELAYDMAALSLANRLNRLNDLKIHDTYLEIKQAKLPTHLIAKISELSWLDPCVGTGVFPLAIMSLLKNLGVKKFGEVNISGWDIDPLALEATRLRMALKISGSNVNAFNEAYAACSRRLRLGSSIEHYVQQGELFNHKSEGDFDIIIGNPPYVKANRLKAETKRSLQNLYPQIYTGSTDLYVYFIASALSVMNESSSVCFVSPAHFTRSNYGKKIREYVSENANLDVYFDFNELEVFKGISSHICVYVISKQENTATLAHLFNSLNQEDYLVEGATSLRMVPRTNIGAHAWNMHTYDVSEIIDTLSNKCISLKQVVGNIYSGIKTGRQAVYAISGDTAKRLLSDEKSKPFIFPYMPPRKIKRWSTPVSDDYLIVIRKNQIVPDDSKLMDYLTKHRESLESRDDVSNHKTWYSLRDCSYYELFEKPKIVYPDISSVNRFTIDTGKRFTTDGAFFLPTDDKYLLGILNSALAHFYFKLRLSGIGTAGNGGRIRFKKVYVENFPVPKPTSTNKELRERIEGLVAQHHEHFTEKQQTELDELVYNLYKVTPEIRSLVEEKTK